MSGDTNFSSQMELKLSGVTKGPADPTVRGGGGAPNRRLNVGQFGKNLTTVLAKLYVLL